MPLQPAFNDKLRRTGRGLDVDAFDVVHLEATHVKFSHVFVALFRTVGVARKTRLEGTCCRAVCGHLPGGLGTFTYLGPDSVNEVVQACRRQASQCHFTTVNIDRHSPHKEMSIPSWVHTHKYSLYRDLCTTQDSLSRIPDNQSFERQRECCS